MGYQRLGRNDYDFFVEVIVEPLSGRRLESSLYMFSDLYRQLAESRPE